MGEDKTILTRIAGQTLTEELYQWCFWQDKAVLNTQTLKGEVAFALIALYGHVSPLFIPLLQT